MVEKIKTRTTEQPPQTEERGRGRPEPKPSLPSGEPRPYVPPQPGTTPADRPSKS